MIFKSKILRTTFLINLTQNENNRKSFYSTRNSFKKSTFEGRTRSLFLKFYFLTVFSGACLHFIKENKLNLTGQKNIILELNKKTITRDLHKGLKQFIDS